MAENKCNICNEKATGKILIDSFLPLGITRRPLPLCNKHGRLIIEAIAKAVEDIEDRIDLKLADNARNSGSINIEVLKKELDLNA